MKPIVFVGTSSEGKQKYGPDFRLLMGNEVEVRFWSDNLFLLGSSALESLVTIRRQCDFAVLLFSGDDLLQKRRTQARAPRDNLLLEFGLFCATLGRSRAFIVHNSEEQLSLPSDLAGITLASFAYSGREHLSSALGLATDTILRRIREEWASDAVRRLRAFDAGIAIAHLVTRAGLPDTMTFHYRSAFREMLKDAFLRDFILPSNLSETPATLHILLALLRPLLEDRGVRGAEKFFMAGFEMTMNLGHLAQYADDPHTRDDIDGNLGGPERLVPNVAPFLELAEVDQEIVSRWNSLFRRIKNGKISSAAAMDDLNGWLNNLRESFRDEAGLA